jgi:hypothetical protein
MANLHRQMLEVLGIKNADKLITLDEDKKPKDPISENMDAMNNKPLKAFIYQDQDAHLQAHQAFLSDPQTAAMIGQSPLGNQITAAMQAHMAEHYGFKYRQMIEQQMGAPLPKPDEELPEEYEIQISRLVAQASQQVLQANQMQAAQQQAQQQMQDPIIQMQMQELQIKGAEVERKKMKDAQDAQLKREQLAIEDKRIDVQAEIEGSKLGVKIEKDKEESQYKQELEGTRLGVEIARSKEKSMIELARIMKEGKKPKGE